MFQSLLENAKIPLSIVLAGLAIKLLDDCLDEEKADYAPYAMCLICISVYLWQESVSLFLCSYIVGMFHDENLKLITNLRVYQEQIILLITCLLMTGLRPTGSSLFIIYTIQLIDDLMDQELDKYKGKKNWALKLGKAEVIILAAIFFTLSMYMDACKTLLCLLTGLLISFIFNKINKK